MVEINEAEKTTEVTAEEIRKVYIKSRDTFYYIICGQEFHIFRKNRLPTFNWIS